MAMLQNKTVLLTGGAGFIGSNLCESLLEHGNRVRCFDNLSTGKRENVDEFRKHQRFAFIEADLRDYDAVKEASRGVDLILHQAALGSVPRSINDPLTTNGVNITGSLHVLEAARHCGVKRVVYAASSSTYGDSTQLPKVEDSIGKPLSPYAVTKYANELYAYVYSNLFGVETIGLRYFNVFGKRQTPEGAYAAAIPRFIKAFIEHTPPEVHGDGLQSRDFTYIANVIQINHLAGTTTRPDAINKVYNVACGHRTHLLRLIEALRGALCRFDPQIAHVPVVHGPPRPGDVRDSIADISRARNLLGYQPTHNLEQGIEEAIDWYWKSLAR
jgi:UDP-N-acetylglucosamine 4-epimerase